MSASKGSIIVYFFSFLLLIDLENNCTYNVCNCTVGPITYRNILDNNNTMKAGGDKLYWSKETTSDSKPNL